jgi:hypothetical protein
MARAKVNRVLDTQTAQQLISMAVGGAEALVMGVGHAAERAIAEAGRAAEDVGTKIGTAVAHAARGSTSVKGRVVEPAAKAPGRRCRRRGVA